MKLRHKNIVVLFIVVTLIMLLFEYIGVKKPYNINGDDAVAISDNTLQAGDWLYLDVSQCADSWEKDGAKTVFYYACKSGTWIGLYMTEYKDNLYRIRIPDDIADSGQFKFFRGSDNNATNAYNWVPDSKNNLTLTAATTNTYVIYSTDYSSHGWSSTSNIFNHAGEGLYFLNMEGTSIDGLTAVFSVADSTDVTPLSLPMTVATDSNGTSIMAGLYQVTIPDGADYDTVQFVNSERNVLATEIILNGSYDPNADNSFYYKRTESSSGNVSEWDVYPTGNGSVAGKKIYFDQWNFDVTAGKNITIQIGSEDVVTLTPDDSDSTVYSYTIPGDSGATQKTIITVNIDGVLYHFLWSDTAKDEVTFDGNILSVTGTYSASTSGTRKIYYDATLSKLSYVGDAGDIGIPLANSDVIYYHAWSSTSPAVSDGTMSKLSSRTIGKNTWSDVYVAEVNSACDWIIFYSDTTVYSSGANSPTKTVDLNIPVDKKNPCFYGDSSDAIAYSTGTYMLRNGYWDEVYNIRDAEDGKNTDIVDITTEAFKRDSKVLYLNTTLYDYYSDFELNGFNRDSYDGSTKIATHRIYQSFRQFNQSLSTYYEDNKASSPLYWGNAQNYNDDTNSDHFTEIADTLGLYGFAFANVNLDMYHKFFYENNSMWGRDGNELSNGNNATLGLVYDKLSSGSLMLKTSNGTVEAPFFDESFLNGNNDKNTVLGEVYHNVSFPFVKKTLTVTSGGETVEYWYYDSADQTTDNKNLQLKQDTDGSYYLGSTSDTIKGEDSMGVVTSNSNYFPFNTSSQSANAALLNYGFGQKIEFTFRLTSDGTVVASGGTDVPIEFIFQGDDDVWVFIDGELVLDVGGGHSTVKGVIDFKNKQATVDSVKGSTSGTVQNVVTAFPDALKNDIDFYNKEHTLTMYYMERGLWESNMKITFNFPDENKLSVEKEVDMTRVNEMFKNLFDAKSVFQFNIKNQATHYETQAVTKGDEAQPKTYNDDFNNTVKPSNSSNIFQHEDGYNGQSDVAHWYAQMTDLGGVWKNERWGIISPATGDTMDVSAQSSLFQFKVYYDHQDTPQLAYMRIELEDSSGHKIGGSLNGKTYGNSTIGSKTWTTIQVDLTKFDGYETLDFGKLKYVKFDYDYPRNFYLDEFTFKPAISSTTLVGFILQQFQIPDYGSATSGKLENAVDALYSTTDKSGYTSYGRVDENGNFALADGQRVTFSNQFRKGSYIYIEESVNEAVFDVSWKLYENGKEITDSTVPEDNTTVTGGGRLTTTGKTISDKRQEIYKTGITTVLDKSYVINNTGYTETGPAKLDGTTTTENTLVFRSYSFPDSETSGLDLLVKQINKVKTGAITIEKAVADGSSALTEEYTIRIEFTNVAGMGLETSPIIYDVKLKVGEEETITGIPAGTIYTITEIFDNEDLKLEEIIQATDGNGNVIGNDMISVNGTADVQGIVVADDDETSDITKFTFVNSLTPSININIAKEWKASDGLTDVAEGLPESILVQIQRKISGEDEFATVEIDGKTTIEITPGYEGWKKQITGLEKYKGNDPDKPYTYRVLEVKTDGTVVESGKSFWYSGIEFEVNYSGNITVTENISKNQNYTITNKRVDTFNFSFTKVKGSGDSIIKLSGAEFTMYEYTGQVDLDSYSEVMNAIAGITDNTTLWKVYALTEDIINEGVFSKNGLSRNSVYYLIETKVPAGMQAPGGCWKITFVANPDPTDNTVHEHIKITALPDTSSSDSMAAIGFLEEANGAGIQGWIISNLEQWNVPSTGGLGNNYSYTVGIGLMLIAIIWGGVLHYQNKKRKKIYKI